MSFLKKMLHFRVQPKREQNLKFTPLSETTSIPICFIFESPPGFPINHNNGLYETQLMFMLCSCYDGFHDYLFFLYGDRGGELDGRSRS